MMEDKHTPGPWQIEQNFGEPGRYVGAPGEASIAKVYSCRQEEANARLIAAAPELLEACRVALYQATNRDLPPSQRLELLTDVVAAAIAKADGRE